MSTVYKDKLVEVTDEGILFHSYYFPFGDRYVAFSQVNCIEARQPSLFTGRWRFWGTGNFRTWFPLDSCRPTRDRIFVATIRGAWRRIGFTVEDSSRFAAILSEKGLLRDSHPRLDR